MRVYLPNDELYMTLDKHIMSPSSPLVICGPVGVGKSSLLVNWAARHRDHHPEDLVVAHWIGASPSSSSHSFILWRVMQELAQAMQLEADLDVETAAIPDEKDASAIISTFPRWVEQVMDVDNRNRKRLVLIIDGIDKLEDRDNALDLVWFPRWWPENVRVVLSTSPGYTAKVLEKRLYPTLEIEPLNEGKRVSFIRKYLAHHGKKLSEQQEMQIAGAAQAANPRFLQTMLEDICICAIHEDLDRRVEQALKCANTAELYNMVLGRLESDYESAQNRGKALRLFCSLVWASKGGLSLAGELEPILESQGIPESEWSALSLVLEELMTNCRPPPIATRSIACCTRSFSRAKTLRRASRSSCPTNWRKVRIGPACCGA